jgi:hypothetical protein
VLCTSGEGKKSTGRQKECITMHGSLPNSEPTGTVKPKLISAKRLPYRLRRVPAHWRVKLALELIDGRVELRGPLTIKQALKLTEASLSQLNEERRSRAGCSLRELQKRQRADQLVARVGADHVMAALDRATMPKSNGMNGGGIHAA